MDNQKVLELVVVCMWLVDDNTLHTHKESKHTWSFVAGRDEVVTESCMCHCSVDHPPEGITINAAIGQDYFYNIGSKAVAHYQAFYSDDLLWDGMRYGPRSTCCSFNNPRPWLCTQLLQPTH